MNYNEVLLNYIDKYPYDEPIFIEDIKKYFQEELGTINEKLLKTLYVYINRLVKENKLVHYLKGIYYKPLKGTFGNKKLNINKVIDKKYITSSDGIKGYYSGAYLFNKLGLTTLLPKDILIVTNECPNNNDYKNKKLGIIIRKPKIEVTTENYKYLQLLDILNNRDNIKIETDSEREIIYSFINDNNLDVAKIFEYARKTNSKKAIERLYELG